MLELIKRLFRKKNRVPAPGEVLSETYVHDLLDPFDPSADLPGLRGMLAKRWKGGELHGVPHWDRVLRNGLRLGGPGVDPLVVACFAYLHDSCRETDGCDPDHGPRAAAFIDTLKDTWLGCLTMDQLDLLKRAVRGHTFMERSGDPTVDACFDADRLDLVRDGIVPDPKRMATQKGQEIARRMRAEKGINN